jgi:hypothetical protein
MDRFKLNLALSLDTLLGMFMGGGGKTHCRLAKTCIEATFRDRFKPLAESFEILLGMFRYGVNYCILPQWLIPVSGV